MNEKFFMQFQTSDKVRKNWKIDWKKIFDLKNLRVEKSSNDSTASPGQNTAKQRMYWRNGIFISFALVYL